MHLRNKFELSLDRWQYTALSEFTSRQSTQTRRRRTRTRWRNEAIVSPSPHLGKLFKIVTNFEKGI